MDALNPLLHQLNRRIDHAALKPTVIESDVVEACRICRNYDLYALVLNPVWVRTASKLLSDSDVKTVSVAGFPLGANLTAAKIAEAVAAVGDGATEIDAVANIAWLLEDRPHLVESEISHLRRELPDEVVLKIIIETGLLSESQMTAATEAVINGGAQFVKTSTGYAGPAMLPHISILRAASKGAIEVKASGGIKALDHCLRFLEAGATRLGTSSSAAIMEEAGLPRHH